jgi:hypothetical protein
MFKPGPVRSLTFALFVLFATQLFGQRYQERDHTVFHRPAPPAKHQSATPGAAATNRTPVTASSTTTRASDSNRRHEATFGTAPMSTESHNQQGPQNPK